MNVAKQQLDNKLIKLLDDERSVSWKYLLPINDTSKVLVVSSTLENIAVSLARSVRHVTVVGLSSEQITLLQVWAKKQWIKNLSIVCARGDSLPFRYSQFDLIVISSGFYNIKSDGADFLSACSRILKPQGFVFYVGCYRSADDDKDGVSARECIKFWKRHGWMVQNVYAFLPRTDRYKLVVPTKPMSVFRSGLRMHNTLTFSSKLQKIGILALGAIRKLEWIIPGYALIITQNEGVGKSEFLKYICGRLNKENLYTIVHNASPGKGAKAILKVIEQNGKASAYIKVADNPYRGLFIESEAKSLKYLSSFTFKSALIPEVISFEKAKNHYILILKPSEERFKRNISTMDEVVLNFLVELFIATSSPKLIHKTGFWKELLSNLSKFVDKPYGKDYAWLKDIVLDIGELMKGHYFPFGMVHRDFVGWNIKHQADGKLYVMDWEWSRLDFIPYQDFFHFILLTEWATSNKTVSNLLAEFFFSKKGKFRILLEKYSTAIGVSVKWSYYFLFLYLVEWTIFHIMNITEIRQWAQETLCFLDEVRRKETFTADKWLKG